ncbi:RNA polymerase I-specific transcription initiation factor rrn3 [Neolecta irregularis DAH-3]|uniref:RNA polymerase I-specific transcription initiation factor rrn3 n=1 Tax=Neolecta irregularis (strain DAH-3) TaxID=1198029 RepID=A0A1U7LGX0_NEOID|nr:RNA polymerase I-specific transcription initiation factor rrn3 [Neolecta irregularis DAH-3]|eukprot:OLL21843.1 RNA polymerase I-specific transcription initiation factor rrn3 [Neolecta irregularis DAH-3]
MISLDISASVECRSKHIRAFSNIVDQRRFSAVSACEEPAKLIHSSTDPDLTSNMFKIFVEDALHEKMKGNTGPIADLHALFTGSVDNMDAAATARLRQVLMALTNVVSQLDESYKQLVTSILKTSWLGRDALFVKAYVCFLGHLVSAHTSYVPTMFRMLIQYFQFIPSSLGRLHGHAFVPRSVMYDRVHLALRYVLDLVPTSYSALLAVSVQEYPHQSELQCHHLAYMHNLFRVSDAAPHLGGRILNIIVDRVLQLDVEIQIELDDMDEEEEREIGELGSSSLTELDTFTSSLNRLDDDDFSEPEEESAIDLNESAVRRTTANIKDMIVKLDCMLSAVFKYLCPSFSKSSAMGSSVFVFDSLLHAFESTILPTFRSRYTQFLVFWAAQSSPQYSDAFLGLLLERALDPTKSQTTRQAASAYLSSFVARSRTLDKYAIRTVIGMLCQWLDAFIEERQMECSGADAARFGGFYSIAQAVFYIFCFRWRDLRIAQEEVSEDVDLCSAKFRWAPGLTVIQKVITSRFNPLKICAPLVVNQFAKVSGHLNFVYCYSILEQNKRVRAVTTSAHTQSKLSDLGMDSQIEGYFPFDPCHLPLSQMYVRDLYMDWKPLEDDEDNLDSDTEL